VVTKWDENGHAIQGGAGAQALRRFFGRDRIRFKACSLTLPEARERCGEASQVLRSFRSFSQAADENSTSRIMVGFHFRDAVIQGTLHGRKVADYAFDTRMKPVRKSESRSEGKR